MIFRVAAIFSLYLPSGDPSIPYSHKNYTRSPRTALRELQLRCRWESTAKDGECAVLGCPKEAHQVCHEHPEAGLFCSRHRAQHTQSMARRMAEMDSRPREPEQTSLRADGGEAPPSSATTGIIQEGARLV